MKKTLLAAAGTLSAGALLAATAGVAHAATINGNNYANTLNGTGYADTLNGYGGSQTSSTATAATTSSYGGSGMDYLSGGAGADYIAGYAADSFIMGGDGNDTLTYHWSSTSAAAEINCGGGWGIPRPQTGETPRSRRSRAARSTSS